MIKKYGDIFTPNHIVNFMLDEIGYKTSNILNRYIIDNSAGNGSFLKEIIKRYIYEYKNKYNTLNGIENELSTYIRGIEINTKHYTDLINALNVITRQYGISNIKWNIHCNDTLKCYKNFSNNDFVVGNPPYVRIHNIANINKIKSKFNVRGMIDLYLVFYLIGIQMLNNTGKLIYITPNSFFYSKSATEFRKYIIKKNIYILKRKK